MQVIVTKYLCPTNTKGARIKATAHEGSITVPYDHAAFDPHLNAVHALLQKLGREHCWVCSGTLPNGDIAHMLSPLD